MFKKLREWFASWIYGWQMHELERYLSQAKDHADLERLMNNLKFKHKL